MSISVRQYKTNGRIELETTRIFRPSITVHSCSCCKEQFFRIILGHDSEFQLHSLKLDRTDLLALSHRIREVLKHVDSLEEQPPPAPQT